MSNITQSGPKGYEYQYEVSLLIALQQIGINDFEMYIEAVGIEDTFLKIQKGHSVQNVEIQVKSEKKLLELKTLTDWLYHFEARSSDENLLKKVIEGSTALFITQSRCTDAVYKFKQDIPNFDNHENLSVRKNEQLGKDFLQYLGENEFSKKSTPLSKKRNELCQKQKLHFSTDKEFNEFFKKVIIWEEVTHSKLEYEIELILNQKFKIPQSRCSHIRIKLYDEVIEGRDTEKDIIPSISQILQQSKPGRPQFKENQYLPRTDEAVFIKNLSENNLLLLTGSSFCGKTELGKSIATCFFEKGFNYKISNSVQVLQEFFNQNIEEDKVAILEDAWGHIEADIESNSILRKVNQLSENLPKHHKLIVTSRTEILQHAFDRIPTINNVSWINLTIDENKELEQYWLKFALSKNLPDSVIIVVRQNLLKNSNRHLLQIGQLEHLANQDYQDLEGKNFDELVHIARQNSKEIAKLLQNKNPDAANLLSVLSLCCNTIQNVEIKDLAYILLGSDTYYSISEETGYSFGGGVENEKEYFHYEVDYELTEKYSELLELLEERGFISVNSDDIVFTHPNYYEAGRYLFCKKTERQQKIFFEFYKRALGCINTATTFLAANQLDILVNKMQYKYQPQLFQISAWFYHSIFPATKDVSLVFRIKNFDKLSNEQREALKSEIRGVDSYKESIHWNIDIPYIKHRSNWRMPAFLRYHDMDFSGTQDKLNNSKRISIREAHDFLLGSRKISAPNIDSLMLFHEGFIRQEAATDYFSNTADIRDKVLIDLIFSDSHPSVVYSAIRGCFIGWGKFSDQLRIYLLVKMKVAFQSQTICIRSLNLMTNFGTDYAGDHIWENKEEEHKEEKWKLWSILFPIFTNHLPTDIQFHTSRFGSTMEDAVKYLDTPNSITILNAWYEIVDRDKTGNWIRDSHASAIMDYLIICSKNDWEVRKPLFDELLNHNNTSFTITSIAWAINNWNSFLHQSEKEKIIYLANVSRPDSTWIKASLIVLNQEKEVAKAVFNDPDFFTNEPKDFIDKIPNPLLRCSLQLLFGEPNELWDLPTKKIDQGFWKEIFRYILEKQIEPFFQYSLNHFFWHEINGNHFFDDKLKIWVEICNQYDDKKRLAEYVISWIGRCYFNIPVTKEVLSILIDSFEKVDDLDTIYKVIVDNIEVIQRRDDYGYDLFKIFDKTKRDILISYLTADKKILEEWVARKLFLEVSNVMQDFSKNIYDKAMAKRLKAYVNYPLKLKFMESRIEQYIKENDIDQELKDVLASFQYELDSVVEEKFKALNVVSFENEGLENWIS